MKEIFSKGTTFIVLTVSVAILVLLSILGMFIPLINTYLSSNHLFEPIILLLLLEILYLSLYSDKIKNRITFYKSENEIFQDLKKTILSDRPESLFILSSGLSSRYQFIIDSLELNIPTKVLTNHTDFAVDKAEVDKLKLTIDSIDRCLPEKAQKYLEIRGLKGIPTVSALILNYKSKKKLITISWYTYDSKYKVMGQNNPIIYIQADNNDISYNWLIHYFHSNWDSSVNLQVYP